MSALSWDRRAGRLELSGGAAWAWTRLRSLAGYEEASYLRARWLLIRIVGLLFVLVFLDYWRDALGLFGPQGIGPVDKYLASVAAHDPTSGRFLAYPTVFWLWPTAGALRAVAGLGLVSAVALAVGAWPRATLAICWGCFLSFSSIGRLLSGYQHDMLLFETSFLLVFLAPSGLWPGLGRDSPPRPLALLAMRFLLLRLMFESGLGKLLGGDPAWRNFSAMDIHYETSPLPTFLGFLDHQLPHAWHVVEALFTFVAELVAPLVLVFGSRRWRLAAVATWTLFQLGIELTGNFAFLNVNALALGLLFLDDRFLSRKQVLSAVVPPRPLQSWRKALFVAPLAATLVLAILRAPRAPGLAIDRIYPRPLTGVLYYTEFLHISNEYHLYRRYAGFRHQVEIQGSNDGGQTWRTYKLRYAPNGLNEIAGFLSPYFPRFDVTLGTMAFIPRREVPMALALGFRLLTRSPDVLALFRENPFPDKPPDRISFPKYDYRFNDWATYRATGRFWRRRYLEDYAPMLWVDSKTGIVRRDD